MDIFILDVYSVLHGIVSNPKSKKKKYSKARIQHF